MQTFLPYSDFNKSAQCLDMRRLGKQRVETLQLLNSLRNPSGNKGWVNHPARTMWVGYENSLVKYGLAICEEWIRRGYKDTCYGKILAHFDYSKEVIHPNWLGWNEFHLSHQSKLIQKLPSHYSSIWPNVPNNLEYIWPSKI